MSKKVLLHIYLLSIKGRKNALLFFALCLCGIIHAQNDTISISLKVDMESKILNVKQEINYINKLSRPVDSIKLLSWANAYRNSNTVLGKRKLEERKTNFHFAKKSELGFIQNLKIQNNDILTISDEKQENIYLKLRKKLNPGESIKLNMDYDIKLPSASITGFGYKEDELLLEYFFIVPDGFEDGKLAQKYYSDIDENQSSGAFWKINIEKGNFNTYSNLPEISPNIFEGYYPNDPQTLISQSTSKQMNFNIDDSNVLLDITYEISEEDEQNIQSEVPKQLKFIKDKIGFLPKKILLTDRDKQKFGFVGTEDIRFRKYHFKIFKEKEKVDLNYFSMLSRNIVNQYFISNQDENHWMYNGLKTYLEIQYLNKNYADRALLGDLPNEVKIWKIKPLKSLNATNVKLPERYGLVYHYIINQNLDQKITTPLRDLSRFNIMAISSAETGLLFNFISQKVGTDKFDSFISNYFMNRQKEKIESKDFISKLNTYTGSSGSFFEKLSQQRNRVNFNLHSYKKTSDSILSVKVSKNTNLTIPLKIQTQGFSGEYKTYWYDTTETQSNVTYKIPRHDVKKILLNDDYIFPETNFRDNYLYTTGAFANRKKIKLKLFTDLPNPEYNEIFVSPRLSWNNYDKFLLGARFSNRSLIPPKFSYVLSPFYSTGTGQLTGTAGVSYRLEPADAFYNSWLFGGNATYFHYDYNLPYKTYNLYTGLNFTKNPRSQKSRLLYLTYGYYEKTLSPELIARNDYDKYNLWNLTYTYSDNKAIHENYLTTSLQWMDDFQKLSAEYYYRWEYAKNKKLMLRAYGGYFLHNSTRNTLFNYGISRVSNYAFNYGLLGQSATEGVLSQQFILAEGGFKSNFNKSVNQWIGAINLDVNAWKIFNIYADAGVYKNRYVHSKFIYDSGLKIRVIPDFLEIYLPVQSTLGFEPSQKSYSSKIRYMLNFNLQSVVNYFRRGLY